jgi:hypothetical protein
MLTMLKMTSYGLSKPWNVYSSNSTKSFIKTSRSQIMSSHRAIRLLKTSLKKLRPSRFSLCQGCRKWVRMVFQHHETSLHRQPNAFFKPPIRQIMSSQGHSPTKNITSTTSFKSLFSIPRMQKHFTWLLKLGNIAPSTSIKSILRRSESRFYVLGAFTYLKHDKHLHPSHLSNLRMPFEIL